MHPSAPTAAVHAAETAAAVHTHTPTAEAAPAVPPAAAMTTTTAATAAAARESR
jgi:hypothetical protein